ncbi:MAG: hypothetical protein WC917_03000 [Bacilli bacterium]|jgi:hypothetical protein
MPRRELTYKGNIVRANTYLDASRLFHKLTNDPISIIYKELTGRYPSKKNVRKGI